MAMIYRTAKLDDLDGVLALQQKYHIDHIEEQDKKDGFVTTAFTTEQLKRLILEEEGLFVAEEEGKIQAYAMAASWEYWSAWPLFQTMIKALPGLQFKGHQMSIANSFQYGPICLDKSVRSSGVLELLFALVKKEMKSRYRFLITFINKNNPRSMAAHTRKLGLLVSREFQFNNNEYYELIYDLGES